TLRGRSLCFVLEMINQVTPPDTCSVQTPSGGVTLRWVPTGKTFASSTTKVDSEPPNGSNADITNQCESEQALDVSVADQASVFMAMTFEHNSSSLGHQCHKTFVHRSSSLVLHGNDF
ncbi:hypothetical protein Tco_0288445, partial [Tanacetum coccineum]